MYNGSARSLLRLSAAPRQLAAFTIFANAQVVCHTLPVCALPVARVAGKIKLNTKYDKNARARAVPLLTTRLAAKFPVQPVKWSWTTGGKSGRQNRAANSPNRECSRCPRSFGCNHRGTFDARSVHMLTRANHASARLVWALRVKMLCYVEVGEKGVLWGADSINSFFCGAHHFPKHVTFIF